MKKVLLTLLMMVAGFAACFAYDADVDGIYYNLNHVMKTAEVTSRDGTSYYGSVTIPKTITYEGVEYAVTGIGESAFFACVGLNSVTIPNSVTSIGNKAFDQCSDLTSVSIPNSVTNLGNYAFAHCSGLTSVSIPNSVKKISKGLFAGCSGLASVVIPESVTSIGEFAFSGTSIKQLVIPSSVELIQGSAFHDCKQLSSLYVESFEDNDINIQKLAFCGCESLTNVTIESSDAVIDPTAFDNTPYKTKNGGTPATKQTTNATQTANAEKSGAETKKNSNVVAQSSLKRITPKPSTDSNAQAAKSLYLEGKKYYDTQEFAKAVPCLQRAMYMGSVDAEALLAVFYLNGVVVDKDYDKAHSMFVEAANKGNALAIGALGCYYENGWGIKKDYSMALKYYKRAADMGEPESMRNYGNCFEKGFGVAVNYTEALKWYRKSADLGDSSALNKIGIFYFYGYGVKKDLNMAKYYWTQAAKKGLYAAQYNLENNFGITSW